MTIVEAIDTIKNPVWRAFVLRFYNTFVAVIWPALVIGIGLFIQSQPTPFLFSSLLSWGAVDYIAGAMIATIFGSTIAGVLKAKRTPDAGVEDESALEG
jgi:hypothetical protein